MGASAGASQRYTQRARHEGRQVRLMRLPARQGGQPLQAQCTPRFELAAATMSCTQNVTCDLISGTGNMTVGMPAQGLQSHVMPQSSIQCLLISSTVGWQEPSMDRVCRPRVKSLWLCAHTCGLHQHASPAAPAQPQVPRRGHPQPGRQQRGQPQARRRHRSRRGAPCAALGPSRSSAASRGGCAPGRGGGARGRPAGCGGGRGR